MADYLLDSNILINHLRGQAAVATWLRESLVSRDLYISVATRTEILAGVHPHEETTTLALLSSLTSLPATALIADQAGRWIYEYARQGIQLSFPDALIAATAMTHDLALVTTNARHFPMDDLQVYPLQISRQK